MFVNTTAEPRIIDVSDWDDGLEDCREVLRIDASTDAGGELTEGRCGTASIHLARAMVLPCVTNATDTDIGLRRT